MTAKHTPGPWEVRHTDRGSDVWPIGVWVPNSLQHQPGEREANANLLVAAPDLLDVAAAPRVVPVGKDLYIGFQDENGAWSVAVPPEMRPFVERWAAKRDAAIAKATGEA